MIACKFLPTFVLLTICLSHGFLVGEETSEPATKSDVIRSLSHAVFQGQEECPWPWQRRHLWRETVSSLDEWSGEISVPWEALQAVSQNSGPYYASTVRESNRFTEVEKKKVILCLRAKLAVAVLLGAPKYDEGKSRRLIGSKSVIIQAVNNSIKMVLPIGQWGLVTDVITGTVDEDFKNIILSALSPVDIRHVMIDAEDIEKIESMIRAFSPKLNEAESIKTCSQAYSSPAENEPELRLRLQDAVRERVSNETSTMLYKSLLAMRGSSPADVEAMFPEPWKSRIHSIFSELFPLTGP